MPSIFISYNPDSDIEQTLAVRLYTIGSVHGFNMMLPDRSPNPKGVSSETKSRILLADYFILFSTSALSKEVVQEIDIAFDNLQDKAKILVVYDKRIGKNVKGLDHCTEVYIDLNADVQSVLQEIIGKVKQVQKGKQSSSDWGWIILTGLSLFALANIQEPAKRKPAKKRITPSKKTIAKKRISKRAKIKK
ncbi:hypothetical protein [Ohtaekwangia sp.]|uniref:hypothetical protein n=1 Tax=Ohtaekwangia sp. TaxID=2066019 RepID=UPI002F92E5B2